MMVYNKVRGESVYKTISNLMRPRTNDEDDFSRTDAKQGAINIRQYVVEFTGAPVPLGPPLPPQSLRLLIRLQRDLFGIRSMVGNYMQSQSVTGVRLYKPEICTPSTELKAPVRNKSQIMIFYGIVDTMCTPQDAGLYKAEFRKGERSQIVADIAEDAMYKRATRSVGGI